MKPTEAFAATVAAYIKHLNDAVVKKNWTMVAHYTDLLKALDTAESLLFCEFGDKLDS